MTASGGGDGFRADASHIRSHSAEVSNLAGRIDTAHGAAETTMNSNAFGVFGQFLAVQAIAQAEVVNGALAAGGTSMHQLSTALDEAASTYERTDEDNNQLLEKLRKQQ